MPGKSSATQDGDGATCCEFPGGPWPRCSQLKQLARPFFKRTEHFHPTRSRPQDEYQEHYDQEVLGTGGPVQISHARQYSASHKLWHATLNALGVNTNKEHLSGSNVGVWTNINTVDPATCERSYSKIAYYQPNAARPNLSVLCKAVVEEIELRQEGDEWAACGVRVRHANETHCVSALREVIISAGSVQSPQLLELSGVGDPEILPRAGIQTKVESPCVGENLQDHFSKTIPGAVRMQILTHDGK